MSRLHMQFLTADLREVEYEMLLTHLGEQLAARCVAEGFPRDEAPKAAAEALANECQTSDDQTVLEWLAAAGRRLGVSTSGCVGV